MLDTGVNPPTDLSEIAAMLSSEVATGILAAEQSGTLSGISVRQVTVRVGVPPSHITGVEWQAELVFEPQSERSTGGAVRDDHGDRVIRPVIAALPVAAIDGLSRVWSRRFNDAGIRCVADLARAEPQTLIQLSERYGTRWVLDLAARARACAVALPAGLDASGVTSGDAIRMTPEELAVSLSISRSSALLLWRSLTELAAALDLEALDRIELAALIA